MKTKKYINIMIAVFVMFFSGISSAGSLIKTEYKVQSGDSLISILNKNYIQSEDIKKLIYKTEGSEKIQKLKEGQNITMYKDSSGKLEKMILDLDSLNLYVADSFKDGYKIKKAKFKTTKISQYTMGKVKYSVNGTLKEMGLDNNQIDDFKKMFGTSVDFKKVKKGTSLVASFYDYYNGKTKVSSGSLVAAEISYKSSSTQVFAFNDSKGNPSYFLKNGQATQEGINREPIKNYKRISSKFTLARKHPILGYTRAHKGVDYAAYAGTPIYAAASGKVAMKTYEKGYGNYIVINHADKYSTVYGHMSRFQKGVNSGTKVKKGEIIGYVGSTGMSTGPHLHFEIRKNGKHLNPLTAKLPSSDKIASKDIKRFKNFVDHQIKAITIAKTLNSREGKTRVAFRPN